MADRIVLGSDHAGLALRGEAAKVARAAAVSVRSATPGTNTAPKAATRRAILEEALAETESRL